MHKIILLSVTLLAPQNTLTMEPDPIGYLPMIRQNYFSGSPFPYQPVPTSDHEETELQPIFKTQEQIKDKTNFNQEYIDYSDTPIEQMVRNVIGNKNFFSILLSWFTYNQNDRKKLPILNKLITAYPHINPTPELLEALENSRDSAASEINYCSKKIKAILDATTPESLDNPLENYTQNTTFHHLPTGIIEYCTKKALSKTKLTHKLKEHRGYVNYDIHARKNLFATACDKDQTFRLWQLTPVQTLHQFLPKCIQGDVKFSNNGKILATITLEDRKNPLACVYLWNTNTKQIVHTIQHKELLRFIAFNTDDSQITLVRPTKDKDKDKEELSIYHLNSPKPQAHTQFIIGRINTISKHQTDSDNYSIEQIDEDTSAIVRPTSIDGYVCLQAIKNSTTKNDIEKVLNSKRYQRLHDWEKSIILKQF